MIRSRAFATAAFSFAILALAACAPTPVSPPPPPAPPPAPPVIGPQAMSERSLLTMAADTTFVSGGYRLSRAGRAKLDGIVPALKGLPSGKIVVYGYTDNH